MLSQYILETHMKESFHKNKSNISIYICHIHGVYIRRVAQIISQSHIWWLIHMFDTHENT